jgi:hypothetical protein
MEAELIAAIEDSTLQYIRFLAAIIVMCNQLV